jgi:hypothetical protein
MVLNPEHMTATEDPHADASQKAAGYITVAVSLAQRVIDAHARATESAATERTAVPSEPGQRAYQMMLGKDKGRTATTADALAAFLAADQVRDTHPDADLAAARAETRLRELHPDAMDRYNQLRASMNPTDAMSAVAPLLTDTDTAESVGALRSHLAAWFRDPAHDTATTTAATATAPDNAERAPIDWAAPDWGPADSGVADSGVADLGVADLVTSAPQLDTGTRAGVAPGAPEQRQPVVAYAPAVRAALSIELADAVLTDPAWPQLATTLHNADRLGADPATILRDAADQRDMSTAKSPARVLDHRVTHTAGDLAAVAAAAVIVETQTHARTETPQAVISAEREPTAADLIHASYPQSLNDLPGPDPALPGHTQPTAGDLTLTTTALDGWTAALHDSTVTGAQPGAASFPTPLTDLTTDHAAHAADLATQQPAATTATTATQPNTATRSH